MVEVKFKLLTNQARLPARGHGIDVGLDVFTEGAGILRPGVNKIGLGFSCEVPVGYGGFIYPRTGMASGQSTLDMKVSDGSPLEFEPTVRQACPGGVSLIAHMPPIDPGYTGEIHAIVTNTGNISIRYDKHTRFGQLVFYPVTYVVPVLDIDKSRGDKGFGASGIGGA